jgi:hypothetical protein
MFEQITEQLKKNTEQFQQSLQNPQGFWLDLQEKQKAFTQELQQAMLEIPTQASSYIKDQQEKAQALNTQLTSLFTKQPADLTAVTKVLVDQTQANVTYHVEKTKENAQKLQELVQKFATIKN